MRAGLQLSPLPVQRLTDTVCRVLKEQILAQAFAPGQKLVIEDLAAQLGVSRTPIKDALTMLASDGLIEIVPRKGTFVTRLSSKKIADAFEVRRALELLTAELLVERATDEDLAHLRTQLADLSNSMQSECDAEEHMRRNMQFHRTLVEMTGNLKSLEIYDGLNVHIQIARVHARNENWRDRLPKEHTEHVAIVDALERRDSARLAAAINQHIRRAMQALIQDLEASYRSHATTPRHPTSEALNPGSPESWNHEAG